MVLEDQIKWYLPLHELDELKAEYPNVVDLSADDLFLISKVSAYSTDDANAVTVSKKLSYKNLSEKISTDLDIGEIKNGIDYLSDQTADLSVSLSTTSSLLCSAIRTTSTLLSTTLVQTSTLLSTTVDANFIKKYGSQLCNLILTSYVDQPIYDDEGHDTGQTQHVLTADLAKDITLTNGKITNINRIGVDDVFSLTGKTIAAGIIYGDAFKTTVITKSGGINNMVYSTSNACYLGISLSVLENDASPSPLELGILDSGSNFRKIAQFNNPGGLQGTTYWNFYHAEVPIAKGVQIQLRYADGTAVANTSKMALIEYKFYAVLGQSELDRYVQKPSIPVQTDGSLSFYKIKINQDGLVVAAEKVEIDKATTSSLGLVKLKTTSGNTYGLSADSSGAAYVYVPYASSSSPGVVKLGAADSGSSCPVRLDSASRAYVSLPTASSSRAGVVAIGASDSGTQVPVSLDSSNKAKVDLPTASTSRAGVIKLGNAPATGTEYSVYSKNGVATVKVQPQVNFAPSQKTSLVATDNILVNCTANSLANYIAFSNLKKQLLQPEYLYSDYDVRIEIDLYDSSAESSTGNCKLISNVHQSNSISIYDHLGKFMWKSSTTINKPFIASVAYTHICPDSPTYGVAVICDGIQTNVFHPKYSLTKPISMSNGIACDYRYLGYFSGSGGLFAAVSDNKAFYKSQASIVAYDYVTFFIKYV